MLADLREFLINPYPWHLAPMGYLRELRGIVRRGETIAEAWRPHQESTRQTVLEAAAGCPKRSAVLVLGSGPLLDVPLAELSAGFERVLLLDIVHLHRHRKALAAYGNVETVQADVTGVSRAVFDHVRRRRRDPLPRARVNLFQDREIDLVVSVNLLSQLTVIPCAYLRAGIPGIPPQAIEDFGRGLVEAHLDWLRRFRGRVALVTDILRIETADDGSETRKDILEGVELPPGGARWTWDIAPRGTVFSDLAVRHEVVGFADFPKQT